ncbi:MAG TPA: GyrI-like domain-containing protein [Burkholderiaceae bacterium]|nr:GyrI-like domain-containing protein [Burkholderiaceae bacterium]
MLRTPGMLNTERPRIIDHPEVFVVGLPVRAAWKALWVEMPKAWRELFARVGEIGAGAEPRLADVSLEVSADGSYQQLVGACVGAVSLVPAGMRAVHIPAQRLLHHCHVGPLPAIAQSFGDMLSWAREHGVAVSDFKLDIGYTPSSREAAHDLYVGLAPAVGWRYVDR